MQKFVERSLKQQKLLRKPAAHANVSPQNVYKPFTSSIQDKLTFLARTTPNIEDLLRECEKSINDELLPNLLKNLAYNPKYRDIFSLTIRRVAWTSLKPMTALRNMNDQFSCQVPYPYLCPKPN